MLARLLEAGEIASPARGSYTSLSHTPLPTIPSATPVPNVANVLKDQPAQEETATILQDENPQEETTPIPSEKSVPMVSNVPTELPGREENSITPTESVLRPGPTPSQET
jgi:hypothetical protein